MNNIFSNNKCCKRRLKASLTRFIGGILRYELNEITACDRKCYVITVATERERRSCCFGCNKTDALRIYRTIVDSTVTPCTLSDIAADFLLSRE